jgi:hypothetical protein
VAASPGAAWPGGSVIKWQGDQVAAWPSSSMARWQQGQVAAWPRGSKVRRQHGQVTAWPGVSTGPRYVLQLLFGKKSQNW